MNIDLTKLITSSMEELEVKGDVVIPDSLIQGTQIRKLRDIKFDGNVVKLCDGDYQISGNLTGIMVLPDDVTLEDVEVNFSSEIEENFKQFGINSEKNLEIIQNRLDITEFLWQNILVEVPLKVINEKNRDLTIKGNGWRLITEEELEKEKSNDSPFSELYNLIDSRKE